MAVNRRNCDLRRVRLISVTFAVCLVCFVGLSASVPVLPRWFDYDYFPVAKPIQDSGTGQVVGTVNPLRPYEPWILDCILYSTDKVEEGKRHERCKEVDEQNEKEYAKFLFHVKQWEDAYPDRAQKWNARFPDAKTKEKTRYEQLKGFADAHNPNLRKKPSGSSRNHHHRTRTTKKPSSSTPRVRTCSSSTCKVKGSVHGEGEVIPANAETPGIPDNP